MRISSLAPVLPIAFQSVKWDAYTNLRRLFQGLKETGNACKSLVAVNN